MDNMIYSSYATITVYSHRRVGIVVADGMVPIWYQDISNHCAMLTVGHILGLPQHNDIFTRSVFSRNQNEYPIVLIISSRYQTMHRWIGLGLTFLVKQVIEINCHKSKTEIIQTLIRNHVGINILSSHI